MAEPTVKGVFILQTLKMLRDRLDRAAFAAFEKDVGVEFKTLNMSYFKDYPITLQNRVEEAAARALWGRDDDAIFFEFGKLSFETLASSAIGRTLLALVGRNPKKMALSAGRLVNAVTSGLEFEVHEVNDRQVSFRFRNNPYRPPGWQGVLDAAIHHTGATPNIRIVQHGGRDTEYLIEWE